MADGKVTILVDVNGNEVKVLNSQLDALEGKSSKAGASIKNIATALGIVKVASAVFNVLRNSLDSAISRFDTMQKFPKVMKALGFSAEDSQKSIDKLSKGIDGLPTKLDDVVSSTQQMTAITGDLDRSTDTVLALNNAFLASGASTEDASRGMQQFNQMLSTGTVDLESWKTLQETMPLALQKTAEAMGFVGKSAQRDLYAALQDGTVTFDEFNDKLIELGTGTGMLASLAKENSLGIATSFGNLRNAVSKGVANVITKFDELTQKLTGKTIAQNIDGLKAVINAAFDSITDSMDFLIQHSDKIEDGFSTMISVGKVLAPILIAVAGAIIALKVAAAASAAIEGLTIALTTLKNVGLLGTIKMLMGFMSPVSWVIAAIGALIAAFAYFYITNEKFRNGVNSVVSAIRDGLVKAFEFLKGVIQSVAPFIQNVLVPAFERFVDATKKVASSGFEKFVSLIEKIGPVVSGVFSKGLEIVSGLLEKFGGSFGKIGGAVSIFISILTKVAIAALGISGPIGLVISVLVSFLTMWAKTGELNADGITKVFDNLGNSITNVAQMISDNLPMIVGVATQIITKLVEGIAQAIPILVEVATTILNSLVEGLLVALPLIINVGLQLLTALINGIVTALPVIIEAATTILNSLVTAIVTALPMLLDVGIQIITALLNAIITALPMLIQAALTIITTLITGIITILPMIIETGIQVLMALIQGIITILPTLIAAALQIIITLITALIAALPQIINAGIQLLMALIQGIISILPQLIAAGIQIITALLGALIKAIPQLLDAGIKLITALVKGVISILPQLVSAALRLMAALLKALISAVPQILSAGIKLIQALIKGALSLLGSLISAGAKLITGLVSKILGFAGRLLSAGASLIGKLVSGITGKIGSVVGAAGRIGSSILNKLRGINLFNIGKNIIQGLISGIGSMVGAVASKISEVAGNIKDKITGALGIHSPSRWMRDHVGKYIPQGIAVGIDKDADSALKSMQRLSAGLMSVTPETALGTSRVGMSGVGSRIVNNTYNQTTAPNPMTGTVFEIPVTIETSAQKWAKVTAKYSWEEIQKMQRRQKRSQEGIT